MSENLKSCPFCGGEAQVAQDNNPPLNHWWVACYNNDCKAMPQASDCEYPKDNTRDGAIKAWNTRPAAEMEIIAIAKDILDCIDRGVISFGGSHYPRIRNLLLSVINNQRLETPVASVPSIEEIENILMKQELRSANVVAKEIHALLTQGKGERNYGTMES